MRVVEDPGVCVPPVRPGLCSRPCIPLRLVGAEGLPGGWKSWSESCESCEEPGSDAVVEGAGGEVGDLTGWEEAVMWSWSSSGEVGGRPLPRMFAVAPQGDQGDQGRCRRLRQPPGPALRRPGSLAGSCDCDSLEGSLEAGRAAGRVGWGGGEACLEAVEVEVSAERRLEVLGLEQGRGEV